MQTVLGYEQIHEPDIAFSREFLARTMGELGMAADRALDCGAGIGRVTKYLLEPIFQEIDLVDQSEALLSTARSFIETSKPLSFHVSGLQEFTPQQSYDCIWVQWVSSQLTDSDLIAFYIRAKAALRQNGCLIVKENVKKKGFLVHKDDFSVTRSAVLYELAFEAANLTICASAMQPDFPEDIYEVKIWALQAKT
jgi:protein N-terminal methyltransferase